LHRLFSKAYSLRGSSIKQLELYLMRSSVVCNPATIISVNYIGCVFFSSAGFRNLMKASILITIISKTIIGRKIPYFIQFCYYHR
jgi:hypothetical protein